MIMMTSWRHFSGNITVIVVNMLYKIWVINHVIRAFISRDIEPYVCIRGFSFILEMDADNTAASVSILRTNLISLMPDKIMFLELIVWVPGNIHMVVIAWFRTIRS